MPFLCRAVALQAMCAGTCQTCTGDSLIGVQDFFATLSFMQITRISPALGALVSGVNLCQPVSDDLRDEISANLVEHQVLFFEDQPLTPVQHRDLAQRFGELHVHPIYPNAGDAREIIVLDTNDKNPPDSDEWHTDVTFIENLHLGRCSQHECFLHSGVTHCGQVASLPMRLFLIRLKISFSP